MTTTDTERKTDQDLGPKIVVIGIGGAGGNAVNNMIRLNLEGVEFVAANTDAQALNQSLVPPSQRIQLGLSVTQGLGAGSKPDVGRTAAEESGEEILRFVSGANMVFITAGMGGGTGTGAAPVVARIARDAGILTVGVVTRPFAFEGANRSKAADGGISELQQYVDTLLIIPNQNLFRLANESTTFADAFKMADNVLYSGVRGVTDLMIMPGLINLDFADIRSIMSEMGKAMMGTGESDGDKRALDAADAAISNPLLDDVSLQGARGVLINITGGYDMTLFEVDEAANRIRDEVDPDANIIFGSTFDDRLSGRIRVSVVATGIGGTQDSIFTRSRDVSGIMGINRKDVNSSRAFDVVIVNGGEPKSESINQDLDKPGNNIGQNWENLGNPLGNPTDKNKRKSQSFFDRFTKVKHEGRYEDDYISSGKDKEALQHRDLRDDPDADDIDIPACFRRKK
ncbi:MAG: cell division protein FtsZ [Holosporales bacterium]|jgi:cell division protein FtsZ|nr:cell division protein FtsZ [Holosporales bacterium]